MNGKGEDKIKKAPFREVSFVIVFSAITLSLLLFLMNPDKTNGEVNFVTAAIVVTIGFLLLMSPDKMSEKD